MIFVGANKTSGVHLGASAVKEIWLGTDKVFSSAPELWTLFDNGAVQGVNFLPNALTRSGSYDKNICDVQSNQLRDKVTSGSQTSYYNGHFVTDKAVKIPATATKLRMKVYCQSNEIGFVDTNSVQIGLIPKDATAASSFVYVARNTCTGPDFNTRAEAKTISGNISAYAGSSDYKVMVYTNQRPSSSSNREIYIIKVWFE